MKQKISNSQPCQNSGQPENNHFGDVTEMVKLSSGSEREIPDIMLSRYACYLIAQNGDPRKEVIAFAQSYTEELVFDGVGK